MDKEEFEQDIELTSNQLVIQNDENVVESHLADSQQESTRNRTVIFECQIDTEKKFIRQKAEELVCTQEQYHLKNVMTSKKISETEKYIDLLKLKAIDIERNIVEKQVMRNNEQKKMFENRKSTYSTREILVKLKKYIDSFRQTSSSLNISMVNYDSRIKYEVQIHTILDMEKIWKNGMISKNDLENLNKDICKLQKFKNQNIIYKEMEKSLENTYEEVILQRERLQNELNELNNVIQEKYEENEKLSEKFEKEDNVELKLKGLDNQKFQCLEIQQLKFERNTHAERYASFLVRYAEVEQDLKETLLQKTAYVEIMNLAQESLNDPFGIGFHALENTTCSELESQTQFFITANKELNKCLSVLREKENEHIRLNCNERAKHLEMDIVVVNLQKELSQSQELYNNAESHLENLNQKRMTMDKLAKTLFIKMENENKILEDQLRIEKEIKANLKISKFDTAKRNFEYEYQRDMVLPYLEIQLKHFNKKIIEIETKNMEEEEKYNEVKVCRIQKIEQCNRAKKYFARFNDATKNLQSATAIENESEHTQNIEEMIEDEQTVDETSTKSILKSPNSPAPQTPKKHVTFKGVPSIDSSSSCDVNVSSQILDPFEVLEPPQYIRNRNFD